MKRHHHDQHRQLSELDDLVLMDDWDAIESKLCGEENHEANSH